VPSRNRTIRPSASCLRYIRKISPLWRFSNLRKLSTIHPTCGLSAPKTSSYESYHWARQLAANRSQKRSGVIILVTRHSEVGEPEVGFSEVWDLLAFCWHLDQGADTLTAGGSSKEWRYATLSLATRDQSSCSIRGS